MVKPKRKPVASSNLLKSAIDETVDVAARLYMQRSNACGLSIGIIKDGEVNTYGYGETEKGSGKLPDAAGVFEIGSITKTFTATLLAWFVNKDKLNLTDPITDYLPDDIRNANPSLQNIKVVHLSNHTSGLPRLPPNFFMRFMSLRNPYKGYTSTMLFSALKKCRLNSPPGEVYAYSNMAAGLLGVILERISSKSFEQLIKEIITGPLEMSNTMQHLTAEVNERFVKGYTKWGWPAKYWDFDVLAACGSLRSTINDLLVYAAANMANTNDMLTKSFMLTHQVTFSKKTRVALGWHLLTLNNTDYYWHNGGTGGFRSFLMFCAERHFAVAILSNSAVSCDGLAINILRRLQ